MQRTVKSFFFSISTQSIALCRPHIDIGRTPGHPLDDDQLSVMSATAALEHWDGVTAPVSYMSEDL